MYNQQTAVARSINEDTWQRWNQYLYLSNEEATRKYLTKKNFDIQKNKDSYNSIIKRLQDAPTARDLDDGDALNAALDQLSDPRIQSSSLRVATEQVPANIVAQIPFRYASEAVTIIMSNLKGANQWPPALDIARFAAEKREFEDVAEQARKEDEDGEISPQTIRRANALVAILRSKLAEQPLADSRDDLAAQRFLKTVAGLVKLLEKPDTKEVLDQLRMVKTPVTIAHLIGFMHVYNLRFAAAATPQQKMIYRDLYPMLDSARDKIAKAVGPVVKADTKDVGDFFGKMNLDDMDGKPNKDEPKPPKPQE
jgi:hypothetical protein